MCIAGDSIQSRLYTIDDHQNGVLLGTMQALNISNNSWSSGPILNIPRDYFGCIVSPSNRLYAIGGKNGSNITSSIEFVSTINIEDNLWRFAESLSEGLWDIRCVILENDIFVIGGLYGLTSYGVSDKVHIIDTWSNEVRLANDKLALAVYRSAPIVVDQMIYAFGGKRANQTTHATGVDSWQYITITPEPTNNPSIQPTESPSPNPTTEPSGDPTFNLSSSTSKQPSKAPSILPSSAPYHDGSILQSPTASPFVAGKLIVIIKVVCHYPGAQTTQSIELFVK